MWSTSIILINLFWVFFSTVLMPQKTRSRLKVQFQFEACEDLSYEGGGHSSEARCRIISAFTWHYLLGSSTSTQLNICMHHLISLPVSVHRATTQNANKQSQDAWKFDSSTDTVLIDFKAQELNVQEFLSLTVRPRTFKFLVTQTLLH